jgi:hypothetical protein
MSEDIKSLEELTPLVSVGKVFKCSIDGGKTWRFVKIVLDQVARFQNASTGFDAVAERSPKGEQACWPLTTRGFQLGMIVREATPAEATGKHWSYE